MTQLGDVGLVGEAVDSEIHVGVAAGLAMDRGHGILKFYSFHNDKMGFKWVNKKWVNFASGNMRQA